MPKTWDLLYCQREGAMPWLPALHKRLAAHPPEDVGQQEFLNFLEANLGTGLARFWLALDVDAQKCVGHVVGWHGWDFGQPYIWIFVAKLDRPYHMADEHRNQFLTHILHWQEEIQQFYDQAGHPTPQVYLRFVTKRPEFTRYLQRYGLTPSIRTVYSCPLTVKD